MKLPTFTNPLSALALAIIALLAAHPAQAADYTFDPTVTVGNWQDDTNWSDVTPPSSTSSNIIFNPSSGATTVTLKADTTVGNIQFDSTTTSTTIDTNIGPTYKTLTLGGSITNPGARGQTFSVPLSLNAGTHTINPATETIAFLGAIIGTGGIDKTGSGRILLNTENTFSGTTLLTQGTIQINDSWALENSTVDTGSSGTRSIVFKPTGTYIFGALAGSLDLVVDSATNVEGITGTRYLTVGQNNASTTYSGKLSGSARFAKAGTGTLTLTGANAYTGRTTVSAGVLQIGNGGTLGSLSSSSQLVDNATLTFNRSDTLTQGTDFNSVISGSGGVIQAGTGTTILTGGNTYGGTTTISAGTLSVNTLANGGVTSSIGSSSNDAVNLVFDGGTLKYTGGAVSTDRNFTINSGKVGTIEVTNNTLTIAGAAAATSGGLTKTGASTLILTGTNLYTGTTTISTGTLQLGDGHASGSLSASSAIVDNATLAFNRSDTLTQGSDFNSVISGTGGVIQAGSGTTSLNGSNTYTGTTLVNAGSLFINGNNSAATGNVTVASGATLGGNGTVGGATTINSGGIHAPGASPGAIGTQTFNAALTYNSGSTFKWDLSGATLGSPSGTNNQGSYDEVVAGGTLSVISGAIFEVDLAGLTGNGSNFTGSFWDYHRTWSNVFTGAGVTSMDGTLFSFGGSDGNGMTVASNGSVAGEGYFYFTGSTLNWDVGGLTPIPEPGTWVALGCLVGSGLCLRSRRRREPGLVPLAMRVKLWRNG